MEPIQILIVVVVVLLVAAAGTVLLRRRQSQIGSTIRRPLEPKRPPSGLAERLTKSRQALGLRLRAALGASGDELWEGIEEALIAADVGVATATAVVDRIRRHDAADAGAVREALRSELLAVLDGPDRAIRRTGRPAVIVVVGVNGVGKTTTIAKLAARLREEGAESLLGAADTFRAAADTQLRTWADRVGVEIVAAESGSDPAAVAFDAYTAAKARGKDAVIIDTAGRLHSKQNLMAELTKIVKVLEREADQIDEVLLVLDATTGQNGVAQTRQFTEAVGVTGIVLTKMDGTAKGGIAIAVERELGIPVKFIGVGEGVDDLVRFEPVAFVDALLAEG